MPVVAVEIRIPSEKNGILLGIFLSLDKYEAAKNIDTYEP